jgi:hypothetical protein
MQEDFLLLDKSFQLKILITSAIIIYNVSKKHTKEKINEIKNNYNTLLKTENHYRDTMFLELISKKLNSGDFEKDKDVFLSNITDEESKEEETDFVLVMSGRGSDGQIVIYQNRIQMNNNNSNNDMIKIEDSNNSNNNDTAITAINATSDMDDNAKQLILDQICKPTHIRI